jgi:uncharacterized protein (DUF1800 family)
MRRRAGLITAVVIAAGLTASAAPSTRLSLPASPLTEDERVLHVLNRLGYGPRPADVARVRAMGVAAYLEQQLDPRRLSNTAVTEALAGYDVLGASTSQLVRDYPQPTQEMRRQVASGDMTRRELRALLPPGKRPPMITAQLQAAAVTRAIVSDAQLEEALAAFWFNHFNVFSQKGPVRWMVPAYEREAIRPHVLGKFRDLVLATARHPAMLFYLDNWMSTRADLTLPRRQNGGGGRQMGLNENYARELMELHTLGVDGGYTQQDVTEVARCFTGWTIDRPREGGSFIFRARAHDPGAKRVLGQMIPAGGGERDGERVIDLLVRHPSTARFISTKLARRFVADDPPAALVDRAAKRFRDTNGDIREVVRTIVTSPEFFAADAYRAKVKSPLEFVVSAVRATGMQMANVQPLVQAVRNLGMPLYGCQPPTGYADKAEAWVNSGALLNRMNFAVALTSGRQMRGIDARGGSNSIAPAPQSRPLTTGDELVASALAGELSESTATTVAKAASPPQALALVLGSPEFQRR